MHSLDHARLPRGQTSWFGHVSFVLVVEGVEQPSSEEDTATGNNAAAALTVHELPAVEFMTEAQRRVFNLLLSGKKEKNIARTLELSPHTVHNHVRAIFKLFAVHSRAELLAHLLDRTVE